MMSNDLKRELSWFMTVDKCPYSGMAIAHPETLVCSDPETHFTADIAKIGNTLVVLKSYGYSTGSTATELVIFIDNFVSRHCKPEVRIVYLEDYSALTGVSAESRKNYITYFKNNEFMLGMVVYQMLPLLKASFNLAKKLHIYAERAHAVHTYEQAVDLAGKLIAQNNTSQNTPENQTDLPPDIPGKRSVISDGKQSGFFYRIFNRLRGNSLFYTKKAKQQLARKYSEALIKFIATIDWQIPGMPPAENILDDDLASKKVFDAFSFVKSEIDTLMAERVAAESVLRESEARYRLLLKHAKAGFLEYDYTANQIVSVNDELIYMTGYPEAELLGMSPIKLVTEESQKIFLKRLAQIKSGEPVSQDIVYQGVTKNNDIRWWLLNSNISYCKGFPEKASVVLTDITILKHTEKQLLEYQEKLKRLSVRLSMIEEDQRRSMASHLHETIGQELFVMQLQLNSLEKSIDNPAQLSALAPIKEQLLKIIKETKNLTFDLSPPVLYDFGFQEAVQALAEAIALKHHINVQTSFEGGMDVFEDEIKVIFYRNLKELIHNCVKHADAENITIRLRNSPSGLDLELCDDGVGFDADNYISETASHDRFGLFDIREKLNHLGGHLIIDSVPGKGTSISMQVPLSLSN